MVVGRAVAGLLISIHAPARGATNGQRRKATITLISIHAPARGATKLAVVRVERFFAFQSTHPRGVRRARNLSAKRNFDISIHAPARGATSRYRTQTRTQTVFQSTHPRGVRLALIAHYTVDDLISIHAPARGATTVSLLGFGTYPAFQSTHPRGVRLECDFPCAAGVLFQSTHPRGVRRFVVCCFDILVAFQSTHPRGVRPYTSTPQGRHRSHFNPRTREGCDPDLMAVYTQTLISIHAPARGATPLRCVFTIFKLFQSTHPRGVRRTRLPQYGQTTKFQSTHPRGVRLRFYPKK